MSLHPIGRKQKIHSNIINQQITKSVSDQSHGKKEKAKESRVKESGDLEGGEGTGSGGTHRVRVRVNVIERKRHKLKKMRVRAQLMSGVRTLQAEETGQAKPRGNRAPGVFKKEQNEVSGPATR